ncbi:MAG: nucleoside deaminase [Marinobacter sp.]|uniref:nucleoside deaminase n=1 Tax=Marinobacter sp. TaxID=50741 RepID=UPI00299D064F|nr:nucleoside deaminase [Marinobacter sp.]MDX1635633.1 nucleoside deaminase [Marinobacter sp.]
MTHEDYMRAAIEMARQAPDQPFGAVIVDRTSGDIVARGVNRFRENPIFHGEIDAINQCAHRLAAPAWDRYALYTTAEPCTMCQAAIQWCGMTQVYFGTATPLLGNLGWSQMDIRAAEVARRHTERPTVVTGGVLEAECNQLFYSAAGSAG